MEYLLWYLIIFLVIFLVLYVVEFLIPAKRNTLGLSKVFYFITKKYDLNMDKRRVRTLVKLIVLANAFILSIPIFLVVFIHLNYYLSLVISFVIFIILILFSYNLIGYILKKKGW